MKSQRRPTMATHAKLIMIHSTSEPSPIRMNLILSLHPTNVSDAHIDCSLICARKRQEINMLGAVPWPVFASRYTHVFDISLYICAYAHYTYIERTLTCIANQSLQSNYVFSERCLRARSPMQCDASPASGHQASPVHIHTLPQLCEGRPLSKAHTQKHARAFREQCSRISRAMSRQLPRKRRMHW